jgi:Uma2 family endonuclease
MSTAVATEKKLWTTEELLAMPDDGVERWLIRGKLYEKHPNEEYPDMTKRNRFHSRAVIRVGFVLERWLETQPEPRGQVVGGEAGFIIRHEPDSTVGIDVAYVSAEAVGIQTEDTTMFDGPPVLAVEILSPSNTHQEVTDKVQDYLSVGVALVWVIDTDFRTVAVYRPDAEPVLFNRTQTLSADPVLPGFSCPVSDLFR